MSGQKGLDPRWYVDREIFGRERDRVFRGNWIPVCRVSDVSGPGDYVTYDLVGDPIVVTRDTDGNLHALANVCRHRNAVIAEGRGNASTLQCPYHLWTYELDGRLASAPQTRELDDFDSASLCLPRLAVDTWYGFVVVNTNAAATPLASLVPGIAEHLDGYALESMVRAGSTTWDSPFNWKVFLENFSESYHHRGVHGQTLQPLFPGERSRPTSGGDQPWFVLDHESVGDAEPFLVVGVFPLTLFSVNRPDSMLWAHIEVHDVDHFTLTLESFANPALADVEEVGQFLVALVNEINAEDDLINRSVQRGLQSRSATAGPLVDLEAAIAGFHAWYRTQMTG